MPAVTGRQATARDRGAVATVVAVLMAGGVLMGFAALAIDIGLIYAEREELVSGADAAALAIGRECSTERPRCANETSLVGLASEYANLNASDGLSNVVEVCGNLPGKLAACTAGPANLTRCLGTPPSSGPFVEVRLSTLLSGGRHLLPPVFAQAMSGNAGDGTEVRACSRVTWERVSVLGLTVATCELSRAPTPQGTSYGQSDEYVVNFQEGKNGPCGPPPGDPWQSIDHAGYLDSNGQCLTKVPESAVMAGDEPPDSGPYEPPCGAALASLVGQAVWVPVHDAHRHLLARTDYRIVSVAKFEVSGYYFGNDPGEQMQSQLSNTLPCETIPGGPDYSCISGVFTGETRPLYTLTGDAIVRLVG